MKKMFMLLGIMALANAGYSQGLGDQITSSLINHVSTHSEWTTKGDNRLALLSSIVEIGKWKGSSIGQLRFGYVNTVTSNSGTVTPDNGYVADAYINIAPVLKEYVTLNQDWAFLNSVEMGPAFAYDFKEHHSYLAFSVGLAFGLNPIK